MDSRKDIIITGGAGFIGSEFVKYVTTKKKFRKIIILDKLTYAADLNRIAEELQFENVELIEKDINDIYLFEKEILSSSHLIHFAAETHVDRSIENGIPFIETNIKGTFAILEAAKLNPEIRVLIVSTDEVYGSINEKEADEFASLKPSSSYSASKASADLLALAAATTFKQKIIISRCCNNYGPGQNIEKFIPNMINSIMNGNLLSIYGNGLNIREWINVKDHVNALWEILINGKIGEIYNIGTADRYTNLELALKILKIFKLTEEQISFVPDRKGHDYRYALNSKKIEKELNWRPNYHLDSDLRNLVKTYIGDN